MGTTPSTPAGDDHRFDFGATFKVTRCTECEKLTRNQGCQACSTIFCKAHYATHRALGCPQANLLQREGSPPRNASSPRRDGSKERTQRVEKEPNEWPDIRKGS